MKRTGKTEFEIAERSENGNASAAVWHPGFIDLRSPNKALEPTTTAVTPRACARVAPAAVVAHLDVRHFRN